MFPQEKFLTFQRLRLFLVVSDIQLSGLGRSLSVISTGSPTFKCIQEGYGVCLLPCVAQKLRNLWAKNEQTADWILLPFKCFHVHVLHIIMVCGSSQGGAASFQERRGAGVSASPQIKPSVPI